MKIKKKAINMNHKKAKIHFSDSSKNNSDDEYDEFMH